MSANKLRQHKDLNKSEKQMLGQEPLLSSQLYLLTISALYLYVFV